MNGEYPALRMVATFHKIAGVLAGIAGAILLMFSLSNIGPLASGWVGGVLMAFGIILGGVFTFGFGSLIDLLMDIERNTRETAFFARRNADNGAHQMTV